MKVKIAKVDSSLNNANITVTIQVLDDAGNLLKELSRGIAGLDTDATAAKNYIVQAIKNVANQYESENKSKIKAEAEKIVGTEFSV